MIRGFLYTFLLLVGQFLLAQGGSAPGTSIPSTPGGGGGTAPGIPMPSIPGMGGGGTAPGTPMPSIPGMGGGGTAPGIPMPSMPGMGGGGTAPGIRIAPIDMYFPILLALAVIFIVGFAYYQKNKKARIS